VPCAVIVPPPPPLQITIPLVIPVTHVPISAGRSSRRRLPGCASAQAIATRALLSRAQGFWALAYLPGACLLTQDKRTQLGAAVTLDRRTGKAADHPRRMFV